MDRLEDGLGSMRTEINHNSQAIAGTRTMNPYGDVMTDYNYGTMDSGYGFTGEQVDPNELVYLRARYYDPNVGVFASLDPFEGVHNRPMSVNGYSWVEGNVANWSDPTGKAYWTPGRQRLATNHPWYAPHHAVQTIAMAGDQTSIHAEYPVNIGFFRADDNHHGSEYNVLDDLADLTARHRSYLDLLDEVTGDVWEIKPRNAEAAGLVEITARLNLMRALQEARRLEGNNHPITGYYNWNDTPEWRLGDSLIWRNPVFLGTDPTGEVSFYAKQSQRGVIIWWTVQNQEPETEPVRVIRAPRIMVENMANREERHPETIYNPERGLIPNPAYAYAVSPVRTDLSGLWNPEIASNYAPRPGTLCSGSCHYPGYSRPSANAQLSQAYAQPFLDIYELLFWSCLTAGGSYIIRGLGGLPRFAFP